jgi:uncharacterized protein (DUF58 family)
MKPARSAAAVGRLARAFFPLSLRGLLIVMLSAGILATGLIRADLAALFWGSSFLLFIAYAMAANHLVRLTLRRRRDTQPDFLSLALPPAGIFPDEEAEARVAARLPRSFPPGISVRLLLPLSWHERRFEGISLRLAPGKNEKTLPFTARCRGAYASAEAILEARDLLGFSVSRLSVPLRESVTVFPSLRAPLELTRFMEQADDSAVYVRSRRRSEELLEARKYYPGDDVRRLNWKVFAHLNELFLRIGEEVPPPESRILFVLDCAANPLVPRALAADYLDRLVETCASLIVSLLGRRIDVMLSVPGGRECRSYTEESRAALLAALADAWWTDADWKPELPGRRGLHVAVFSSPGSPGLERILSRVRSQGWSVSLFIKGLDPEPPADARRLKEMLFLPEKRNAGRQGASGTAAGKERAALADALARDLATYRGPSWKVRHAAEI